MQFKSFSVLLAATAVTSLAGSIGSAVAAPIGPSVAASQAENAPNAWFVELKSAPASAGTSAKALQSEKQAFRDAARAAGVKYTERMAFDTLWNGFSINASSSELAKIQSLPGVSRVFPVVLIDAPERGSTAGTPDLYTAITMSGADIVQNELGYTGKGIKVAVMDTGVDVDHPAFGGDGVARNDSSLFPSARVA
jgi:subtilisin family serine protease